LFEKAIEMDPHLASAFMWLASAHYCDVVFGWTNSPDRSTGEMLRAAERSVALDGKDAMAHLALASAYSSIGHRDKALSAAEIALELNPNLPLAYYWRGVLRGDIADLEKAIRLSPRDPDLFLFLESIGFRHLIAGRCEDALRWAQRSLQRRPDYFSPYLLIAASNSRLGRMDEARAASRKVLELESGVSLATVRAITSFWDPADRERYVEDLRKAGLPEGTEA
jgi:tetratricopeptide (TPR) repeat protein